MSTCQSEKVCSSYVDNELSQSLKHSFEKHMSACEHCAQKVKKYSEIRSTLRSGNESYNTEEGYNRLKDRMSFKANVNPPRQHTSVISMLVRVLPAVAAAVIVAVLLPRIQHGRRENQENLEYYPSSLLVERYFYSDGDAFGVAPMQLTGVILEQPLMLLSLDSHAYVSIDPTKFTEIDVFKPKNLTNNEPIEIILFDSPAVVLQETDNFGFSNPVFLLRE